MGRHKVVLRSSNKGTGGRVPGSHGQRLVGKKIDSLPKDVKRFLASNPSPVQIKSYIPGFAPQKESDAIQPPKPAKVSPNRLQPPAPVDVPFDQRIKRGDARAHPLIHAADRLARFACWDRGHCQAEGVALACSGELVWGHILSRQIGATRWHNLNCVALCDAHEKYYHGRPEEFEKFIEWQFPGRFAVLERYAAENPNPDPEYWIAWYTEHGFDKPVPPELYDRFWRHKPQPEHGYRRPMP